MPNKLIRANDGTVIGSSFFIVGSVQQTFLGATEFESIMGSDWVLADGRDVTGSLYESVTGNSTVPDCRGRFLRTVGGNANATIGGTQEDEFASHNHAQQVLVGSGGSVGELPLANSPGGNNSFENPTQVTGGTETRPVNITVNTYIKIN